MVINHHFESNAPLESTILDQVYIFFIWYSWLRMIKIIIFEKPFLNFVVDVANTWLLKTCLWKLIQIWPFIKISIFGTKLIFQNAISWKIIFYNFQNFVEFFYGFSKFGIKANFGWQSTNETTSCWFSINWYSW